MASDALVEPFGAAIAPLDLDPQRLAASLHDAARQKAVEAFGPHKPEFESLELETTLWDLVARLNTVQTSDPAAVAALVISWVQSNLNQPPEPANLQSIKWMYTRSQVGKRGANTVVSELDLDAPLRQARPIADEDRSKDETLYKYVFELLLAGEYQIARMACADTNNWLIHAALNAMLDTTDNGIAIGVHANLASGFTSGSLVSSACRTLSSASSSQISPYEAGIYGLLCGNLAAVKPLCESWETLLLVHLLCGASLETFERSVAQDHKIALQGSDWHRRVALMLIQNRTDDLVAQIVSEVGNDTVSTATSAIVQNPWLTRVLLHVQLATGRPVNPTLVQIYVEYLCQDYSLLEQRLDLIPEYVRLLDGATQATIYGHVLAQITDAETQLRQIELANKYGVKLAPAVECAIQLNFDLYLSSQDALEDANQRLVGVLHWPVAAEQWPAAASALVRAYVLLFSHNSRSGIILLTHQISAEYVRDRAMDSIRSHIHEHPAVIADLAQLRQYALLGNALTALNAWTSSERDGPGWRSSAPKLIGNVIDSVNAVLQYAAPSSAAIPESAGKGIDAVRRRYIPEIVYELFDLLREAQSISSGYARMALEFATKIADEDLKLYELFDERLLQSLAEPALALR